MLARAPAVAASTFLLGSQPVMSGALRCILLGSYLLSPDVTTYESSSVRRAPVRNARPPNRRHVAVQSGQRIVVFSRSLDALNAMQSMFQNDMGLTVSTERIYHHHFHSLLQSV